MHTTVAVVSAQCTSVRKCTVGFVVQVHSGRGIAVSTRWHRASLVAQWPGGPVVWWPGSLVALWTGGPAIWWPGSLVLPVAWWSGGLVVRWPGGLVI